MRHRMKGRKFCRTTSQRRALFSGLAKSVIQFEQIKTTLPKAKDLRPYVEKLVTIAKKGDLAARRHLLSILGENEIVTKLMDTLAKRYEGRQGGYTRVIKAGFRYGDNAPMAVFEFIDRDPAAKPKGPSMKDEGDESDMTPEEKAAAMASAAVGTQGAVQPSA